MTGIVIAAIIGSVIGALWWAVEQYGHTQPRTPRRPVPPLHEAQHRVTDSGERPGDDDQWHRLRTQVPHIRRQAVAEQRAEDEVS